MEAEMIEGRLILPSGKRTDKKRRVILYDFKRPDKFSQEQMRTLEIIHETFARLVTRELSVKLRLPVKMEMNRVDQMTFREFIESLPPACPMGIVQLNPLKGSLLLEMDPPVASAAIDRLFGGRGEGEGLTGDAGPVQRAVWEDILRFQLKSLGESWNFLLPAEPRWGQLETNPHFAQIVPPDEMVVNLSLAAKIGGTGGYVNICFPFQVLEPVLDKLSARFWYSRVRKNSSGTVSGLVRGNLETAGEIVYAAESLSLKTLGELKAGSLVKLENFDEDPIALRMGGAMVLKLRRRKEKRLVFEPLNKTEAESLLKEGDEDSGRLESLLGKMDDRMERISRDLARKINRLEERLDNRDDRILLSSGERPELDIRTDPFGFLSAADVPALYQTLSGEHSQICAFVISRMDPLLAASLLSLFEPDRQTDLIGRICRIEWIPPELTALAADNLEDMFSRMEKEKTTDPEGVALAVEILNNAPRTVEKNVVLSLERTDGELAEEIKKSMFVFEDIVLLEGGTMRLVYERVDRNDFLLAMKTVTEKAVLDHISSQLTENENARLAEDLEGMGRVKISDVDRAQQRIIERIRTMEENGEIFIGRPDEMV